MVNVTGVDLNLLTAFEAMAIERNVTRAAARIGMAQPSMSNALSRLRALFDDPLFVRVGNEMRPTQRSQDIAPLIGEALDRVRMALSEGTRFDPAVATRSLRLATTDYGEMVLVPALLARLRALAPGVTLICVPFSRDRCEALLERDEADLCLSVIPAVSPRIVVTPLFDERFVGVARRGHPALPSPRSQPMGLARYAALDHLLVSRSGPIRGAIDERLEAVGHHRRIAATVSNFASLLHVIGQSDLVGAAPSRLVDLYAPEAGVEAFALPEQVGGFRVSLAWHNSADADPAHRWLRELIMSEFPG